jgi:hypothetical protein
MGQPHLVLAKANTGSKLFYDEDDFESYVSILLDLVRDQVIELFGFCLHFNELRLLLSPSQFPLSRIMQRIHGSHTLRINHRQKRRGPLFQGRFESKMLGEDQLIDVLRNIHLWPVRKGLVRRPENYPWSTHAAYLDFESPWSNFLMYSPILQTFSDSQLVARRGFARYVESAALEPEEALETVSWVESKKTTKGSRRLSLPALAKRVSLLLNINMLLLHSVSRRQDLVVARRLFATAAVMNTARTVTEVAAFLKRDKAQVSRLVSQGMDLVHKDEPFRLLFNSI